MREGPIERHLKKRVGEAGGRTYKWVSPGNRGVPDRLVFFPGAVFLVETKSTTGVLSAMQKVQKRELAKYGFDIIVLNSIEQVDEWVAMQVRALDPKRSAIPIKLSAAEIDEINRDPISFFTDRPRKNAVIDGIKEPCGY